MVARVGVSAPQGDIDDWALLTERATIDTLGSLTDGQFELPLRRPAVTADGLIFAAGERPDAPVTTIWGYEWETTDSVGIGTFDDGSEFGGTVLTEDGTFVVAALEPGGDWDLWVSVEEDFQALAAGCLLYTSPSPRDATLSRMPSSA